MNEGINQSTTGDSGSYFCVDGGGKVKDESLAFKSARTEHMSAAAMADVWTSMENQAVVNVLYHLDGES